MKISKSNEKWRERRAREPPQPTTTTKNKMSRLTWEILSHLAAADASNPDWSPPLYAQRQDTSAINYEPENRRVKLFFMACPLYESQSPSSSRAVFSLERIKKEFMHVLQMYSNEKGKLTPSEIGMWLGMDEVDVRYVGNLLCEKNDAHAGSQVIQLNHVHGESFALKTSFFKQLAQKINIHCNRPTTLHPSMDDLGHKKNNTGTVTTQQLAQDMGVSVEDITRLLQNLLQDREQFSYIDLQSLEVISNEKTGCIIEVRNRQLWREYFERQIMSVLIGSTTPVSVS